jgi:transcriptional regulator with XRE-family HTH domain
MNPLQMGEEQALHREVAVTLLRGMLRQHHGLGKIVAQKAGISEVYLSNIVREQNRFPTLGVAERIAAALPVARQEKIAFLHHVMMARQHGERLRHAVKLQAEDNAEQLVHLLALKRDEATFSRDRWLIDLFS